ncbi:ABC transporter permease [Clostridium sp. AF18-27]|jgi:ABC-type dipeptide/oligopeptide/nickel transport system permease subunit|uniref:Peptide/nickel transport system permease protein n=1 Tax=Enterocloster lavalensis TaxID=460384 RepID=A0A1I0HP06_9FIRM|nr:MULTISPECIES: ABC transporter permease [Enterocloster]MBS5602936.1 ABC transporter permease [Enterocloster asparagiformis]RHR56133.1 ABC transporter permease [Clostridium sp. AF18-27]MCB6341506.1 ABC transporter permease [Enterocloster lavalensis]MDR3756174.1 ABC transporter permease [Enterocloster sp.]SET85697.1 peptide/nickel transport system permease protein [Enterocloster lavalensis]
MGKKRNWRKFFGKYNMVLIGGIMFLIMVIVAFLATSIAPYDPQHMNMMESLRPPSAAHLCGTDEFGRDVFSRIIYGARISLSISLSVLVLVGIFGTVLGMLAGFYHTADTVIMRFMDGLMAFPTVILALVILTVLGSGIPNLVLALSITQLPRMVRTVRTTVISAKQLEHVEAARAMGASDARIMFRYILPLCVSPMIVRLTLIMALTVLNEASLTFLGVGLSPDIPSWGTILSEARQHIYTSPYLIFLPGLAILWSVMSLNLLGDGLRDVLDPKLSKK